MDPTNIIKHFKGRDEWIAIGHDEGFRPERLVEPLSAERFEKEHLSQQQCLGFYLMDAESRVWCSCLDFDHHPPENPDPEWRAKAETYYFLLCELGLLPVMEISSSGSGAHLWLHFTEPVPAFQVRNFWKKISNHAGVEINEIYPRQDTLRAGGLGNLVRYPLFGRSKFVDVESDWEQTELDVKPIELSDLVDIAAHLGHSLEEQPNAPSARLAQRVQDILKWPDSVLARRWRCDTEGLKGDQSKSTLAFCIVRELIYQRIPDEDIKQALKVWMMQNDYLKHINDERWIEQVLRKAYEVMGERDHQPEKKDHDLAGCASLFIKAVGTHQYMESGIPAIDQSIDGIAQGELALLVARPGHGKSTLALQWLLHQSSLNNSTLMLSAEMSHYELGRRMIQMIVGGDEKTWINHRSAVQEQIDKHFQGRQRPFVRCLYGIDEVEAAIKQYVDAHAVSLVAVDYIQLLDGGKEGRYEEVTEISRRLKNTARTHNVGILALCQASRNVERRDSIQFNLSDLRESGQLEQDADLVLAGYWHGRGTEPDSSNQAYELHALKRRNGPIRKARMELRFVPEKQLFCD